MKRHKLLFLLSFLLPVLSVTFTACRMDNKNNTEDYSHYSNEDKAKVTADTATPDHTKVEKNDQPNK